VGWRSGWLGSVLAGAVGCVLGAAARQVQRHTVQQPRQAALEPFVVGGGGGQAGQGGQAVAGAERRLGVRVVPGLKLRVEVVGRCFGDVWGMASRAGSRSL
jgi:hypothetical protein